MAPIWFSTFFENANVLRTRRETRGRSVLLNRSLGFVLRALLVMALCWAAGITPL